MQGPSASLAKGLMLNCPGSQKWKGSVFLPPSCCDLSRRSVPPGATRPDPSSV